MQLISIEYGFTGSKRYNKYYIKDTELGVRNLIVGRNSTGKSRLVQLIASIAKMMSQKVSYLFDGQYQLVFKATDNKTYKFSFEVNRSLVTRETLMVDSLSVLQRKDDKAEIYSVKHLRVDEVSPPDSRLVMHVRRDKEEYPYFEKLIEWSDHTYGFKFGNITPHSLAIDKDQDRLTSIDEIPRLLNELNRLDSSHLKSVVKNINSLGYKVKEISVESLADNNVLYVLEDYMTKKVPQHELSQGMFRTIALLVFLEYLSTRKVSTIIVDDLCEGLDYGRAKGLGRILFENEEFENVQIIATTNDSFLMDIVDIDFWNVLVRDGCMVKALNYRNSEALFNEFRYTGLSNFDLFSSDYLLESKR